MSIGASVLTPKPLAEPSAIKGAATVARAVPGHVHRRVGCTASAFTPRSCGINRLR